MLRSMVKSKIHRATVSDSNLTYQGSITIDAKIMQEANILPFEYVHINNASNAAHWETYAIPGKEGEIILNGPPARLFQPGDQVVILSFLYLDKSELEDFKHVDVFVDDKNRITGTKTY